MRVDVHLVSAFIIETHFFNYRGIFPLSMSATLYHPTGAGKMDGRVVLTRVKIRDTRIQLRRIGASSEDTVAENRAETGEEPRRG